MDKRDRNKSGVLKIEALICDGDSLLGTQEN